MYKPEHLIRPKNALSLRKSCLLRSDFIKGGVIMYWVSVHYGSYFSTARFQRRSARDDFVCLLYKLIMDFNIPIKYSVYDNTKLISHFNSEVS